jgi:Fe-Mn family superoxide dismutase
MTQPHPDRRSLIAAATGLAASPALAAAAVPAPAAPSSSFAAKPLPFDAKTIAGLSERLLVSHHDNNYVGAVTRLGAITKQVAALDPRPRPASRSTASSGRS